MSTNSDTFNEFNLALNDAGYKPSELQLKAIILNRGQRIANNGVTVVDRTPTGKLLSEFILESETKKALLAQQDAKRKDKSVVMLHVNAIKNTLRAEIPDTVQKAFDGLPTAYNDLKQIHSYKLVNGELIAPESQTGKE